MRSLTGFVVMLAVLAAGCDNATTPLAPTPQTPLQAPLPSHRLNGVVMDTAFRPMAGAAVEIVDGPLTGTIATTDAQGRVIFEGPFDNTNRLRASSENHVSAIESPGNYCGACNPPARWVVFYLEPTAPPVADLSGSYTLTVMADPACPDLPDHLRSRTYDATVAPAPNSRRPAGTHFETTLDGAWFVPHLDRFPIGVAGNLVALEFWGEGLGLVEQLAPLATLGFGGRAEITVNQAPVSTIATTFEGVVDYCVLNSATGRFYECGSAQAETHVACESRQHRLTLTRR